MKLMYICEIKDPYLFKNIKPYPNVSV